MDDEKRTVAEFDRLVGALEGLPDMVKTKPATVRATLPLVGIHRSFIVQSYRQWDVGDTVFIETVGNEGMIRIALPPEVAEVIARQRDALTRKSRSKLAKRKIQERIEAGETVFFVKKPKKEDKTA